MPTYQICEEWPFYFQLPVLMIMLITLLNDGALISIGYDNVVPSTVRDRSNGVQTMIKKWSNTGLASVKHRSTAGQSVVKTLVEHRLSLLRRHRSPRMS